VPRKKEKNMKKICAVLGLALLMGCASNDDCPRKKKDCGNNVTKQAEAPVNEPKTIAQEAVPVVTPSK
jgi:hypothetical protein